MSVKAVRSKSKDKYAVYEEKKELIRTDDATVEVTVKVKKRRDKSKGRKSQLNPLYDAESMAHKTGSWGDLLLRKKKLAESQTSINLNNAMLGEEDTTNNNNHANGQNVQTNILTKKSRPRPSSHHRIIKIPVTDNIHVQAEIRGIESKSSHRKYKSKHHHHQQQHHPVKGIYRNPAYGICKGSSSNNNNYHNNYKHDERHSCHSHHIKQRDLKIQLPGDYNYDDGDDLRCCDACTCHIKSNGNGCLEDQASQTSLPILPFVHKDKDNNNNNGSSTVKVQLVDGKSPPTKDHEKYQRQNGKQVISQGTTTTRTTTTITKEPASKETVNLSKPKISHSAPNHNSSSNNHRNSVSNNDNNDANNIKACHYQYNSRKNDRKTELDVYNSSSSNSNNNNNNNNDNISIPITRMEDAQVQTVKRSLHTEKSNKYTSVCTEDQPDNLQILQDIKKLTELEVENDLLKKDTVALLMQVDKAKNERQEYITTIKELYELAEVLRHENVILIGTQEEHRSLQEKLLEAISENQALKHHLHQLANVQNQATQKSNETKENYKQDDLWKVRDVLKEVKTAIAEEIQGLKTVRRSPTSINHDSSVLEMFTMTNMETSRVLNDTNIQCDDEIERILHDNNNANAERSDVRSSTQYLEMEMPDIEHQREGRRYITPTPESDASDFSPRFSTPARSGEEREEEEEED